MILSETLSQDVKDLARRVITEAIADAIQEGTYETVSLSGTFDDVQNKEIVAVTSYRAKAANIVTSEGFIEGATELVPMGSIWTNGLKRGEAGRMQAYWLLGEFIVNYTHYKSL